MQQTATSLTECDKEQIQFIESIQSIGTLVALDANNKIVFAAPAERLGLTAQDLIGKSLEEIIPGDTGRILSSLEGRVEPTIPILIRSKRWGQWLTCIGHQQGDYKILELEFLPDHEVEIPSIKFVQERRDSLESYLAYIAENIQSATGYDRVMVYKFAPDWHGEVVAESIGSKEIHSFYGHHFPATDIPVPARNLFLKNFVRMIAERDYEEYQRILKTAIRTQAADLQSQFNNLDLESLE